MKYFLGWQGLESWVMVTGLLMAVTGCGVLPRGEAEAQSRSSEAEGRKGSTPVDVAIARTGTLREEREYIGTTGPVRQVSLRSQAEGQLLNLNVDVGDAVSQGQGLVQLDDDLLLSAVNQARAEQAAQQSEVVSNQSQVGDARTKVEQARLQLQQAQADITRLQRSLGAQIEEARLEVQQTQTDASRLGKLAREGAVSLQQAEQAQTLAKKARQTLLNEQASAAQQIAQARTAAKTAGQVLRSAQEQVRIQQQGVAAAQGRVAAQQAVVAQTQERQSYAVLTSPITGVVLERLTEPGNLVQPGAEILKLGDFSHIKVSVQVSELELANIRGSQAAQVRLDAFPNQRLIGKVTRISPAADPTARLVPVEVTVPNPRGQIGSGLLARVSFPRNSAQRVVVPETALPATVGDRAGNPGSHSSPQGTRDSESRSRRNATIFVITGKGKQVQAKARPVTLGEQANGQVEILSGLKPGEQFVARSGQPLKDGLPVQLSILSETTRQEEQP